MRVFFACLLLVTLAGCANKSTREIGIEDSSQAYKVKFGTIVAQRRISVRSDASGATAGGAMIGGLTGAVIGQTNGAALAGLLIGGVSGALGHQFAESDNGVEYTITLADGGTIIIAQIQASSEPVFEAGAPVLVQFGAKTNRVLSAAQLPELIARPKAVRVRGVAPLPAKLDVKSCEKATNGASTRESCTTH